MKVNAVIKQFVSFINVSNDGIKQLYSNIENEKRNIDLADILENGYYQFIWEIIVESQICSKGDYLEPYGDGADFYGESSRVVYPEKFANKKIIVSVVNKVDYFSKISKFNQNLDFIKFVSFNGKEYSVTKPFDFVLCENQLGKQLLFRFEDVDFWIINIRESTVNDPS